jgi:hypothetical protein
MGEKSRIIIDEQDVAYLIARNIKQDTKNMALNTRD